MSISNSNESEFNLQLGHVLKQVRSNNGLTQQELENITGVQRGYISDLERGKKQISVFKLFQLCNGFSISSPTELIERLEKRLKENENFN